MTEERCPCPEEYPDWNEESVNLSGYCVHEMKIPCFFHMPVSYDLYVHKQAENIQHLELKERWPGFVLTKTGMVGGKILRILEDAQSPSRLVHYIAGDFLVMAQLHNGGIGTTPKAAHKMQIAMVEKGCMPKELYLVHLTCDDCRDRKGGDKVLMLRRYTANKRIQQNMEEESRKAVAKAAKKASEDSVVGVVDK
ncbi:MAG: hypothetical protein OEM38_08870 [Gammaproteobacteria bacterium]|nr:hypothetical protein [Gammaproteobacteria bacterium]